WTINLPRALPDVFDSVSIHGPGANALIVNGNQKFQLFKVTTTGTVTLSGITIANGFDTMSNNPEGGGIQNINSGTVNVTNCTLDGNHGYDGGAITNYSTLLVAGSTIKDNSSGYYGGESGGGIENSGGMLTVTNSTISGNQTYGFGGGIFNMGGA